jgi:hypothetical protein
MNEPTETAQPLDYGRTGRKENSLVLLIVALLVLAAIGAFLSVRFTPPPGVKPAPATSPPPTTMPSSTTAQ